MKAYIIVLLSVVFLSFSAMAEGNGVLKLRRISYIVKGVAPTHQENQELRSLSLADQENYINNKIDEYLSSTDFLKKSRS